MQKSILKTGLTSGLIALAGCTALFSQSAQAEPTGYNQVSFSVESSVDVKNDEVTATLYKEAQASNPKQLAIELNTAINQAMRTAKKYPSVTVTTGSQNTYPKYKDEDIVGWTGSVSVNLKSSDFEAASQLIADLQNSLVMRNIQFGISKPRRDAVEKELLISASKAFKEQAMTLATAWDTSGYQVISVNLNTQGNYYPIARPMVAMAEGMKSAPAQNFEGGSSEVKVMATGTIELIP